MGAPQLGQSVWNKGSDMVFSVSGCLKIGKYRWDVIVTVNNRLCSGFQADCCGFFGLAQMGLIFRLPESSIQDLIVYTVVLMCFKWVTMVKVMTTSKAHELNLPRCTMFHAPIWLG